jgi:hypothetical protein
MNKTTKIQKVPNSTLNAFPSPLVVLFVAATICTAASDSTAAAASDSTTAAVVRSVPIAPVPIASATFACLNADARQVCFCSKNFARGRRRLKRI